MFVLEFTFLWFYYQYQLILACMASTFNDFDIILEMVESGNVFWEAINDGELSKLKLYLESGRFDVDEHDIHGRTALHIFSCRGIYDAVNLLLDHGADVMKKDNHDNTPLHWCGHLDVIELLVDRGADVFARNSIGATPREMAERRGIDQCVIDAYKDLEKHRQLSPTNNTKMSRVKNTLLPSLFHEFSKDLSKRNLVVLILGIFAFSLYLTYTVMGASKVIHTRIPVYTHPPSKH